MKTNLTLWLNNTMQKLSRRTERFENSFPQTKYWLIGGGLLCLLMLALLAGCNPQIITRCGVDRSLIQALPIPVKPEKPTNGDLATSHNGMIAAIALDNERKARLVKQLSECQ